MCDDKCIPCLWVAAKIAKKQSGDGRYFELKVFSYQPRSQNSVDHDFSTANRVAHDTKQSLKVAKALDEEFRRAESTDGITALLAEPEVSAQGFHPSFVCFFLGRHVTAS